MNRPQKRPPGKGVVSEVFGGRDQRITRHLVDREDLFKTNKGCSTWGAKGESIMTVANAAAFSDVLAETIGRLNSSNKLAALRPVRRPAAMDPRELDANICDFNETVPVGIGSPIPFHKEMSKL